MATSALETRKRWREISRAPRPSALRVALLASYTIDPLAPYLGVLLEEAGHPAEIEIGPYNQIVQQCLDAASQTAATRPDVVVVSPRFEELAGQAGDLLAVADAAVAAVRRWRGCRRCASAAAAWRSRSTWTACCSRPGPPRRGRRCCRRSRACARPGSRWPCDRRGRRAACGASWRGSPPSWRTSWPTRGRSTTARRPPRWPASPPTSACRRGRSPW